MPAETFSRMLLLHAVILIVTSDTEADEILLTASAIEMVTLSLSRFTDNNLVTICESERQTVTSAEEKRADLECKLLSHVPNPVPITVTQEADVMTKTKAPSISPLLLFTTNSVELNLATALFSTVNAKL